MPRFGDLLVCGISRQLRHRVEDFDEVIATTDADFASSGLVGPSLIRLGFLALLSSREFLGDIGSSPWLRRLSNYLQAGAPEK